MICNNKTIKTLKWKNHYVLFPYLVVGKIHNDQIHHKIICQNHKDNNILCICTSMKYRHTSTLQDIFVDNLSDPLRQYNWNIHGSICLVLLLATTHLMK